MKKSSIRNWMARIPVKWKLTLWSAFLLFVLFAAYNAVQYIYVEKWMVAQERTKIENNMNQLLNELLENEYALTETDNRRIRQLFYKVNEPDQLIRIIDQSGNRVISVANELPDEWVEPVPVTETEIIQTSASGHSLLIMRSPITIFEFNGTIEMIKSMDEFDQLSAAISRVMLLFTLGATLLCGLAGGLLAWRLLKPLQSMAVTIRKIKQDGLQERMQPNNSEDELAQLMILFNEMMDQVERSFQQQSQFVEDASHELRTPIAIMEGHLAMLQRWGKRDPAILEESLHASTQELLRLKGLVQELLTLTRVEHSGKQPYATVPYLDHAIHKLISNLAIVYPDYRFEIETETDAERTLDMSQQHFEQVMLIILDNAMKYSKDNKLIEVRVSALENRDRQQVSIAVTDYGIGIAEQHLPYVMDRFYRVDKARSRELGGTGLGLAIADRIVQRYNGMLEIQSKEHEGTRVTLYLPIVSPSFTTTSHSE